MNWLDRLFARRRHQPCFDRVPARSRPRLRPVCEELTAQERRVAAMLDLPVRPRLSILDEELAVIIGPDLRHDIEASDSADAVPVPRRPS